MLANADSKRTKAVANGDYAEVISDNTIKSNTTIAFKLDISIVQLQQAA